MNFAKQYRYSIIVLAALVTMAGTARAGDRDDSAKEKALIEKLQSDAPSGEKAIACKELAVYGSAQAVGELAKLLSNAELASWSRIALEAIPGPEASKALRDALDKVNGRLLVGTINSIGVRRDENAVDPLVARLQNQDADVASAAAVALGHIANPAATKALRGLLAAAPAKVKSAAAEGCVLCAERLMADGKTKEAIEIYDEVRKAEVPKQRVLEATRGAILARGPDGIPVLVEQLRSKDLDLFRIGLSTARELKGPEVGKALVSEVAGTSPERGALLLMAFADRADSTVSPPVIELAKNGQKEVRIAAIGVVGRLGNSSGLPVLVEIAGESDSEIAAAAKNGLAALGGESTNADILARLSSAEGKSLATLIELVGLRRIDATPTLLKALDDRDQAVRSAALAALGETVGVKDLSLLIAQVISPKNAADAAVAQKALRAACVRMPQREECATELSAAMSRAPAGAKPVLLEVLGAVGGEKSLATIGAAVKGNDEKLQDTGSRILGEWMTLDAAPVLLDLAKTAPSDKYQVRALRGYLRLARQFATSDEQRAEMCQKALDASSRPTEQKLVISALERFPSPAALAVAMNARQIPALKEDATRAALVNIQKLGDKAGDARELLAKLGIEPVKVEIVKAEFGAGANQKDVTGALQQRVGDLPLISLPSPSYSKSFGGDPAPGTAKRLKVQYRINGKAGEVSFPEDSIVMLPMPK